MLALIQNTNTSTPSELGSRKNHLRLVPDIQEDSQVRADLRIVVTSVIGLIALVVLLLSLRTAQYNNSANVNVLGESNTFEVADGLVYTVAEGDSLWAIADHYSDGDPRELVYEISELNGGERIWPGQKLVVPVSVESFVVAK